MALTVLLDFEARSDCDLKTHGGRLYAEHPSTEALVCVLYDTETGDVGAWYPGLPCPVTPDDELGAHNADMFDRFIAGRVWGPTFAEGHRWVDTSILARRAGLPGALEELGHRWLGMAKDKVASSYTVSLSNYARIEDAMPPGFDDGTDRRPPAKGNRQRKPWAELGAGTRSKHAQNAWLELDIALRRQRVLGVVTEYCASDVELLAHGWDLLKPFHTEGVFGGWEADVLAADRVINERGVNFDAGLARRLLECDQRLADEAVGTAAKAWGETFERTRDLVFSPKELALVLGTPNAKADTIDELVKSEDPKVCALALARQAIATIARGKLEAGLNRVSADGRIRDQGRYYGAHTGRWSHTGMQMGNMPRPENRFEKWGDDEVCDLVDRIMAGYAPDTGEIMVALRATLEGNAVCDYSGVEARGTAWIANDTDEIDVFKSGKNPYFVAAANIYGVPYDSIKKGTDQYIAGKMAVLACGYQGGPNAVRRIALSNGVDLDAKGIDVPGIVKGWRASHPKIVQLWKDLQKAFIRAAQGYRVRERCFEFVPSDDGRDVAIFLPSGRPIVYGNVGLSQGKYGLEAHYVGGWNPVWKCSVCGEKSPAPLTVHTTDRSTCIEPGCGGVTFPVGIEKVYGGLITENVVQALCRDLLADAMVKCERDGLPVVLTVHDEIVVQCPFQYAAEVAAEIKQHMLTLPEWAAGFPVGAAAHYGRRYRK